MIDATAALDRLREGNARFVTDGTRPNAFRFESLAAGQEPFAVVVGCSDSRVPIEIVFDQGPGDLFVIRVAGNIVAPSQIASIEFAADRFGTQLAVVVGHTGCGAVQATIDTLRNAPGDSAPGHLSSIVDRIRPAIEGVPPDDAVRANVRASVHQLCQGSRLIERLVSAGTLRVVGAEYSLETGIVTFLDDA